MTGASLRSPPGRAPSRGCYPWDLEEIGYLLVTVFLLVNTLLATLSGALAGIILVLIGLPVYEYFRRQAGQVTPPFWQ